MNIVETLAEHRRVLDAIKLLAEIKEPKAVSRRRIAITGKSGRRAKYPWMKLQLNQSFLVPCAPWERQRVMNSLTSCIANARTRHGRKFCQRSELKGIRVWRTA